MLQRRIRFSDPAPPRTHVCIGGGWGYGVGCGVGLFYGIGVTMTPPFIFFGAGAGPGAFCGVGFGAGLISGLGSVFIPVGASMAVFYGPRLDAAEDFVQSPPPGFSAFMKKSMSKLSSFARRFISQPSPAHSPLHKITVPINQ